MIFFVLTWWIINEFEKNKPKTINSFAEIGDCHEPKEVCCVFHVLCGCFLFFLVQKNICLNKLVHAFWLPVLSSHLISVPPNWQRHATKQVRSFIPCHFIQSARRARSVKGIARHIDASSVVLLGPSNFWLVRPEHAHVSYPGLSFRPPGFSPYMGREERRVQGLD